MGKGGRKAQSKSRGERKDDLERKRDERAKRSALRREKQAKTDYSIQDDEHYVSFCNQLQAVGLKIKEIPGDGNCLFRALADQIDGDHNRHMQFRRSTVQFMRLNVADFQPFHDGETTFDKYLELLDKDGTFAGNDAIVAFARNNNVDIVIHQHSSPKFVISAPVNPENTQLHIAYHNGEHYSSLRRIHDTSCGPAHLQHICQSHTPQDNPKHHKEKACQNIRTPKGEKKLSEVSDVVSDVSSVMQSTNCKDPSLVKQTLKENGQDVDAAIAYILQLLSIEGVEEEADGKTDYTDPKQLQNSNDIAQVPAKVTSHSDRSKQSKQQQHLSNRQRKELAKQGKKKRRLEEQKAQETADSPTGSQSQGQGKDVGTVVI